MNGIACDGSQRMRNRGGTRTILFGAGFSALNFIQNHEGARHFLACLDNASWKWGMDVEGVPIVDPNQVDAFDFEEVVISSHWVREIRDQLVSQLGVDPSKIVVPPKHELASAGFPFRNSHTRDLATSLTLQLVMACDVESVPLILDMGTLLGVVRDGQLIEWDSDIDLLADQRHVRIVEASCRNLLESADIEFSWTIRVQSDSSGGAETLSVFVFDCRHDQRFVIDIDFFQIVEGSARTPWFGDHVPVPKDRLLSPTRFQWLGRDVWVPSEAEAYLELAYGHDWRIPKPHFSFEDYPYLADTPAESFEEAAHKGHLGVHRGQTWRAHDATGFPLGDL